MLDLPFALAGRRASPGETSPRKTLTARETSIQAELTELRGMLDMRPGYQKQLDEERAQLDKVSAQLEQQVELVTAAANELELALQRATDIEVATATLKATQEARATYAQLGNLWDALEAVLTETAECLDDIPAGLKAALVLRSRGFLARSGLRPVAGAPASRCSNCLSSFRLFRPLWLCSCRRFPVRAAECEC